MNNYIFSSALMFHIGLIKKVWLWLTDGAAEAFWGSRLFWAIAIALAVMSLISFIIGKRQAAKRRKLRTAAMDRLRDDNLTCSLQKVNKEDEPAQQDSPGAFLLRRQRSRRRPFMRITISSELSTRELILSAEKAVTIGRNEKCTIALRDRFVSEQHCTISPHERKLYIIANQSEFPTFARRFIKIHQVDTSEGYRLRNHTKLQIGISLFEITIFKCRIPGGYL